MTKSQRIILNTLATYGRSVLSLFVGVFSSRWLLMGMGERDLGLQCVVGSLVGALVIFETVMQVAVARFYAYAVGETEKLGAEGGADEICHWFNVVFLIHLVLPLLVVIIGYPLGLYAVEHWLTIPPERMNACRFVFQCSLAVTFITMISTPYIAMYQARQLIVELSVFSVIRTIVNFGFTFSLLYVTCDKLVYAALFGAGITLAILGTQMFRARRHFPECRVRMDYLVDIPRLKRIFVYFFWEIFSCVGNMTRQQGSSIVINKYFGPSVNAAWQIAQTLSAQAMAFSAALQGALQPAVTVEAGAGEQGKMIHLAMRTCKFSALLILVFSVPLIAEIDEVLRLWLVKPPVFAGSLCTGILIAFAIDKVTIGHHMAVSANGKIGLYHAVVGTTFISSIPIALGLIWLGFGPSSIGHMFIVCYVLISLERLCLARCIVRMSILAFVKLVLFPILLTIVFSSAIVWLIISVLEPSFGRIVITSASSSIIFSLCTWCFVFDREEKKYIVAKLYRRNRS